ncbi:hypothetical protein DQ04_22211000, partial [Trypanosoma grayi]|uniref:hypothetical protein n=1 Tax=Trypanosoma grayi TaxID=71804 RepID=UPI0004F4AEAF
GWWSLCFWWLLHEVRWAKAPKQRQLYRCSPLTRRTPCLLITLGRQLVWASWHGSIHVGTLFCDADEEARASADEESFLPHRCDAAVVFVVHAVVAGPFSSRAEAGVLLCASVGVSAGRRRLDASASDATLPDATLVVPMRLTCCGRGALFSIRDVWAIMWRALP